MLGRIHSFQSFSTVDGPGVRCVVFLQGCLLRCKYCHNPETWDYRSGEEMDSTQLIQDIKRLKSYIRKGGVTFSGGEALEQPEFLNEMITQCKEASLHTCLDTSGMVMNEDIKKIYQLVDLVLLDVKMTTEDKYHFYTGGSLNKVMETLIYLRQIKKPVWIRQVIIKGINDTENDIEKLHDLLKQFDNVQKVEFLPFRKLCVEKYEKMSLPFYFKETPETSVETITQLQAYYNSLKEMHK